MKKKEKIRRKLLSFLLTLAMVVGLVPGMGLTAEAATIQYDDYLVEVTNHNQNFIAAGICDQTTGLKCKTLSVETARALENYLKSKTGSKVAVIYGCTIRDNHPGWSRISFVIDGTTAENYYMDAPIARAISNRGTRNEAEYKLFYVNTDAPDFETANETVTFKVINGQWDDGTTEDVTVSLSGLKDEIRLAADQIPAVGTKPNDTYKAGSWDVTPSADTAITAATTYTYTYAQKESISQTVTFKVVNGSWNDETTTDKSVPLTGYEGDTLKLTAAQIPEVGTKPNDTYKAGSWDVIPNTDTAITEATTYTYTYVAKEASVVTKAPEAKTLTYNESAQELVTAGTATGGEMQYALGTATEATQPYTTSIPTATDAGTYYVWYKVVGDANHNSTEPNSVEAKINPVDKTDLNTAIEEAEAYYESIKEDDVYAQVAEALK
ncbi:MAG: copper resistance protein CopC, partial [Schwartzia sp.]|nr:copper resistance protein CopC [Schwartzia sp. (in: firmicutes)]